MSEKLEIDRVGKAGSFYLEADDIEGVQSAGDDYAADLSVTYRRQYQAEESFEWQGSGSRVLRLRLVARQVLGLVAQLREASDFCSGEQGRGCWDFGKTDRAPRTCLRCLLLEACRHSGHGDYRNGRPPPINRPGCGYAVAMMGLVLVWWWTLCQWADAGSRLAVVEDELRAYRKQALKPSGR